MSKKSSSLASWDGGGVRVAVVFFSEGGFNKGVYCVINHGNAFDVERINGIIGREDNSIGSQAGESSIQDCVPAGGGETVNDGA